MGSNGTRKLSTSIGMDLDLLEQSSAGTNLNDVMVKQRVHLPAPQIYLTGGLNFGSAKGGGGKTNCTQEQ
jgi:hypothetical protein